MYGYNWPEVLDISLNKIKSFKNTENATKKKLRAIENFYQRKSE